MYTYVLGMIFRKAVGTEFVSSLKNTGIFPDGVSPFLVVNSLLLLQKLFTMYFAYTIKKHYISMLCWEGRGTFKLN